MYLSNIARREEALFQAEVTICRNINLRRKSISLPLSTLVSANSPAGIYI